MAQPRVDNWLSAPNLITFGRLILIFPTLLGLLNQSALVSLFAFALIIVSDILDGVLARRTLAANPLGTLFDHGADAIVNIALCVAFSLFGLCPIWLPLAIALAFSQYAFDATPGRGHRPRPSALGKINGISYYVFSGACLVFLLFKDFLPLSLTDLLGALLSGVGWCLLVTTVASIFDRLRFKIN